MQTLVKRIIMYEVNILKVMWPSFYLWNEMMVFRPLLCTLFRLNWATFYLCRSSNIRGPKLNWKAIYDFLCVFIINFSHNMVGLWNIPRLKLNDLDFPFQFHQGQMLRDTPNSHIWHTRHAFHTNFDHKMHYLWDTNFWSYVSFILPSNVIQSQWGRLKYIWLRICVSWIH